MRQCHKKYKYNDNKRAVKYIPLLFNETAEDI